MEKSPPTGLWTSLISASVVVISAIMGFFWTQIASLQSDASMTRTHLVEVCSALVEIETQFRASDQVRNLMHKKDMELITVLWLRVNGSPYPGDTPYLPTIAQDHPAACK